MFYFLILIIHILSTMMYPAERHQHDPVYYTVGPNPLCLGHNPEEQNLERAMRAIRNLIASENEISLLDYEQAMPTFFLSIQPCLQLENRFKPIYWRHAILQFTAEQQELILCHPTAKLLNITATHTYARKVCLINTWEQEPVKTLAERCIELYMLIQRFFGQDTEHNTDHIRSSSNEYIYNNSFRNMIPRVMIDLISFLRAAHALNPTDSIKQYMYRSQLDLTRAIDAIQPQPAHPSLNANASLEDPEES